MLHHSSFPGFPIGRFNMTISSSFIFHPSFGSITTDISWLGYISVEMDVYKDFPMNNTTEKVNFSVPLSAQHTDTFNSSISTMFSVSYSGLTDLWYLQLECSSLRIPYAQPTIM